MDEEVRIKQYESKDYEKVMTFLQSIDGLQEIEEELFPKAILIEAKDEILGMITYEMFRKKALIRYFIFEKELAHELILQMYEMFFANLRKQNIKEVYAIVTNPNLSEIFTHLGFKEYPKENFFLTEECILNTKYRNAMVMMFEIPY
ncbi:MAG: GNAT family N-acetyltransferase [Bacilli bacterium]|nr:GNAT family N-acetyltransferase [Bacilli bacterium]